MAVEPRAVHQRSSRRAAGRYFKSVGRRYNAGMGSFLFSIVSYAIGMSSLAYYFWIIEFQDRAAGVLTVPTALFNIAIFLIFPLQHSILARDFIKQRMSPYDHRAFYVLTSGVALWIVL